jgi:23S rRNA pseudouridine2605 synthase
MAHDAVARERNLFAGITFMAKRSTRKSQEPFHGKTGKGMVKKVSPARKPKDEERPGKRRVPQAPKTPDAPDIMRLNRFLAHAGVASRRKADELIAEGQVRVNGEVVLEMGRKILPGDQVEYRGKVLKPERFIYVLLNKPRGFLTTTSDDRGRRTVMELVERAGGRRIYPVGRLDRNTSGLLLLTNDGELAEALMHPRYEVEKVYAVKLNEPLRDEHFAQLKKGITLDDGPVTLDEVAFPDSKDHTEVGVSLHSGRNRIVRRMFEHLGYEVVKLDRVVYAGLTKKDLPRGKWRLLSAEEVRLLKHFRKPPAPAGDKEAGKAAGKPVAKPAADRAGKAAGKPIAKPAAKPAPPKRRKKD